MRGRDNPIFGVGENLKPAQLSSNFQARYNTLINEITKAFPGASVTLKTYTIPIYEAELDDVTKLITMLKVKEPRREESCMIVVEERSVGNIIRHMTTLLLNHLNEDVLVLLRGRREIAILIRELLVRTHNNNFIINIRSAKRKDLRNIRILCPRCYSIMEFEGNGPSILVCSKCGFCSSKLKINVGETSSATITVMTVDDVMESIAKGGILRELKNVSLIMTAALKSEDVPVIGLAFLMITCYRALFKSSIRALALITHRDRLLLPRELEYSNTILFLKINPRECFKNKLLISIVVESSYFTIPLILELINSLIHWSQDNMLILVKDELTSTFLKKLVQHKNVIIVDIDEFATLNSLSASLILVLGVNEAKAIALLSELEIPDDIVTLVTITSRSSYNIRISHGRYSHTEHLVQTGLGSFNIMALLITLLMLHNRLTLRVDENETPALADVINELTQTALSDYYLNLLTLAVTDEGRAHSMFTKLIELLRRAKVMAELLSDERAIVCIKNIVSIANAQIALLTSLRRLDTTVNTLRKLDMNEVRKQLVSVLSHVRNNFYVGVNDEEILLMSKSFTDEVHKISLKLSKLSELISKLSRVREYDIIKIKRLLKRSLSLSNTSLKHIELLGTKFNREFDRKAHPSIVTELVTTMRMYYMMKQRQLNKLIANMMSVYNVLTNIIKQLNMIKNSIESMNYEIYERLKIAMRTSRVPIEFLITIANHLSVLHAPAVKAMYLLTYLFTLRGLGCAIDELYQ
mgnify:CR=1 FL=1